MKLTNSIDDVVEALKKGGVVAFPTETSYGLFATVGSESAVEKIFKIKTREKSKTLSVLMKNLEMIGEYVVENKRTKKLFKSVFPGPVTIICTAKREILGVTKNKTIALRVSKNKHIQELFAYLNEPITATSANISGQKDLYSANDILETYKQKKIKPDLVFDGGEIPKRKPTTIIDATQDELVVVRQGEVDLEKIKKSIT